MGIYVSGVHTECCIECHMVFYVTDRFPNDTSYEQVYKCRRREISMKFMPIVENKVGYVMHPNIFGNEIMSWMIKIWMENHFVSYSHYNFVKIYIAQILLQVMTDVILGLHLVLVTIHRRASICIEQDK